MKNIKEFILKNKILSNIAIKVYNQYNQLKVNRVDFKYKEAKSSSITKEELLNYNRNRNFKVSKVLCFAPKSSMIFSFDGNVYLCCENKSYPIGNVLKQSISEIWFGEQRQFLDNEINNNYNLSHGCQSCEWKIKSDEHSLALAQSFDLYSSQSNSNYPARLDFEIHNTCNLECVMCGGIYSSSIQANRNKESAIKMLYDHTFVEQLNEFIPHLKYVNFIGGEPTLIKIYYDIMDMVIKHNPKCLIHLQTNASKLNERFKDYLNRGNYQIGISIDSLNKEKMETIRKNIVFNEFMQNVNYYVQLYLSNKIKLTVNTCPMPENWSDVIDVIDFCNKNKISISFSTVKYPFYSSFESSNIEFINQVIKVYREKLQTMPRKGYFERNNYNRLKDLIQQVESYIPIIQKNDEIKSKLMDKTNTELLSFCQDRLSIMMEYNDKERFIEEYFNYLDLKIKNLEVQQQKEILLILITSIKGKKNIINYDDSMKWFKEFVNTLTFSYLRNHSI